MPKYVTNGGCSCLQKYRQLHEVKDSNCCSVQARKSCTIASVRGARTA